MESRMAAATLSRFPIRALAPEVKSGYDAALCY